MNPHTDRPMLLSLHLLKPLLAFLSLGVVLSGCNNSPYPPGEAAKPILYNALGADPKTLDPTIGYDEITDAVIVPIYASFLHYQFLKRDPFVLEPDLGAAMPERKPWTDAGDVKGKRVTHQGEEWTFHIKHGLRFQDDPCFPGGKGREILAQDFLYCFRRMGDPAIQCPIVSYLDDKVAGMAEYEAHQTQLEKQKQKPDYSYPMAGLVADAQDPYTFRIRMKQIYPQLRYLMAMHFTSPLAHEAVDKYGKELARHPVGCGPYLLVSWRPKGGLVLKANPNYHEVYYPSEGSPGDREAGLLADSGKRVPFIKEIHTAIITESVTAWNLFQQGYLDAAVVTQSNFQTAMNGNGGLSAAMKARGLQLRRATKMDVWYYIFNMNDPVVGGYTPEKRKLRQALSLAVDTQEFLDLLYTGMGTQAQTVMPPGLFGYDANYRNPYRQPDIARAKQLMAEAGYPGGISAKTGERLSLFYDNMYDTPAGRQATALLIKQLEPLGVKLESRAWRFDVYQERMNKGQFQFTDWGWNADYPDPENFDFLAYSQNVPPGGPNYSYYHNPQYDALFEKMRSMDDTPERLELIKKMRALIVEDCPLIYREHQELYGLRQPWYGNYKPNPLAFDTVKYYQIDGPLRVRLQKRWNQPNFWPLLGMAVFLVLGSLPAYNVVRQRTRRHVRREGANAGGDA